MMGLQPGPITHLNNFEEVKDPMITMVFMEDLGVIPLKILTISCLRLPHRNDAKIAKNLQPLDVLVCNSANKASF